jgi:O-antigen/teichoic acid export membrane protein
MAEASIGRRIAAGGATLIVLRLSIRMIGLVSILVLFRLLDPADFGIVALAMLVVGFVEVFSEFGFEQALLRNPQAQRTDYDVTWTLNFLRGLAVSIVLAMVAPYAAEFLKEPRLTPVLLVLAVTPLLDGLQNIGVIDFSKNLEFHKEFRLRVAQKLTSFFVTIAAALLLRNYWALVLGVLAGRIAGIGLGYALHPYRPRFSLHGWRAVLSFSTWILLNNVTLFAGNQTDKVVVQRTFSAHTVGILRVAEEISGMVMELVWPIEKALYAGYVKIAHQIERFRQTLTTSVGLAAIIGVPISLGLGALAEPSVAVVLGDKGREAVPFVQVYVLYGAIRSCLCGIFPVFMVLGRPEVNTQVTLAAVATRLCALLATFPVLGLIAVPWSMVAGAVVMFVALWWRVTKAMQLSVWVIPAAAWRAAAAALVMWLFGRWGVSHLEGVVANPVILLILVPACTMIYLSILYGLWWICRCPDGPEQAVLTTTRDWWAARRLQREVHEK